MDYGPWPPEKTEGKHRKKRRKKERRQPSVSRYAIAVMLVGFGLMSIVIAWDIADTYIPNLPTIPCTFHSP